MPIIIFTYDLKKDADNFLRTHYSLNRDGNSKLYNSYLDEYPDIETPTIATLEEFIRHYIDNKNIDIIGGLQKSRECWEAIQYEYFQRINNIFNISLSTDTITAYSSINDRYGYNIEENYFFISAKNPDDNNLIIAHELFHFYTWHRLAQSLKIKGISISQYNDIKESLTEILNLEFADLLNGKYDEGYPQHKILRQKINILWRSGKKLDDIVLDFIENLKK